MLFVLALATGLTVPALNRGTESLRIRAEVAGFSATLRHAREQAIVTQRPHAVVVNPGEHRMTVVADDGDVRASRPFAARLVVEATPPPALTVRFDPHGASTGAEFRLSASGQVWLVSVEALTGRVKTVRQ